MIKRLKLAAFKFNGSAFTEKSALGNGFKPLTGLELKERIINKEVTGEYPGGFTFVARIYENGTTEGVNNFNHYDSGRWIIDLEKNTMLLQWDNGWYPTMTHAYDINGTIEFFDTDTGLWRTTFKSFTLLKKD